MIDTDLYEKIQAFKNEKKGNELAKTNVMDETPG